jgi:hypothetical protein
VASIQEVRLGDLGVTAYRNSEGAQNEFPEGIVTKGPPTPVLIFQPYTRRIMRTGEGLASTNGMPAWQVLEAFGYNQDDSKEATSDPRGLCLWVSPEGQGNSFSNCPLEAHCGFHKSCRRDSGRANSFYLRVFSAIRGYLPLRLAIIEPVMAHETVIAATS